MRITEIKEGKRGRSYIFCEGEYIASISTEVLIKSGLKVGNELDFENLEEIKKESDIFIAKEKAINLLSYRGRSKGELKDKLMRSVNEVSADLAIEKMESIGLVDDVAFAKQYARELLFNKRLSISGIKYKMREKKIDNEIIESIIDSLEINEEKQALFLIRHKFSSKMNDEKGVRKAINALIRLGYSWSVIKSALAYYNEGVTEDELT